MANFPFNRREHLTEDDLHKNKALIESFTKMGNIVSSYTEVNI